MTVLLASLIEEESGQRLAKITAPNWRELCFKMESLIVAAHAAAPKSTLKFHIDGHQALVNSKTLHIECLNDSCVKASAPQLDENVPLELVGAMTLVFHTAHEGHRLSVVYDGVKWQSPLVRPEPAAPPRRRRTRQ